MAEIDMKELLDRVKAAVVKLSEQKTKLSVDGLTFEFTGQLGEGTELSVIEGELVEKLKLEDGREILLDGNTVTKVIEEEEESDNEEVAEFSVEEAASTLQSVWDTLDGAEGDISAEQATEIVSQLQTSVEQASENAESEDLATYVDQVDVVIDLIGGGEPLNEDAKAEAKGLIESAISTLNGTEAEGEEEEEMNEHEDDEMEDDEDVDMQTEERVAALEAQVVAQQEQIDAIQSEHAELYQIIEEMTALNETLTANVEKLSKAPAVEPKTDRVKGTFNKSKSRAANILSA